MNVISNDIKERVCDCCKKPFSNFKLLIGVHTQKIVDKKVVGAKSRVFLCPNCYSKLDESPQGMGVVTESGMTGLGTTLKI